MDESKQPKSDYEQWMIKKVVPELTELRNILRNLHIQNTITRLDRLEPLVLQSKCSEAKDLIKHIMEK